MRVFVVKSKQPSGVPVVKMCRAAVCFVLKMQRETVRFCSEYIQSNPVFLS